MNESLYAVGELAKLQASFPSHDFEHSRKSCDGSLCIVHLNAMPTNAAQLTIDGIVLYSHDELTTLLQSPAAAGVWYEPRPQQ